jgi:hypothetical protein
MAEHEQGIWGGEAGDLARRRSPSAGASLTLPGPQGSEWGLAALLTAGFCMVLCPTTLLVWASIVSVHAVRWSRSDVHTMCILVTACEFLVAALAGMALAFGIVGLIAARKNQTPVALPLTGLIVSVVTLVFWIVIIGCSFATTGGLW